MLNIKRTLVLITICLILTGCQHLNEPFNKKQIHMLQQQGFTLTDDGWSLGLTDRITFEFDQAEISQPNQEVIAALAKQLKQYDLSKLRITGYTDNVGQSSYNQILSEKRAQHIANIFIANGFNTDDVKVIGKGPLPLSTASTDTLNYADNRRVTVTVIP